MTGLCQEMCLYIIRFPREGKSLKQLPNFFDHTTPFSQSFRGTRAPWEMTWKCSVRRITVAWESGVGVGLTTPLIKIVAFAITFPHQSLNFFIWKEEAGSDMMRPKVPSSSLLTFYGSVMKNRHKLGVMSSCPPFPLRRMPPFHLHEDRSFPPMPLPVLSLSWTTWISMLSLLRFPVEIFHFHTRLPWI